MKKKSNIIDFNLMNANVELIIFTRNILSPTLIRFEKKFDMFVIELNHTMIEMIKFIKQNSNSDFKILEKKFGMINASTIHENPLFDLTKSDYSIGLTKLGELAYNKCIYWQGSTK